MEAHGPNLVVGDYSARPFVMDLCEPVKGYRLLDIGCGEGYVGRELLKRGAAQRISMVWISVTP